MEAWEARAQDRRAPTHGRGAREDVDDDDGERKPADPLSADKLIGAVTAETAAYLHANKDVMKKAGIASTKSNLASFIGTAPEELRQELRRALLSNGHVDSQG